MVDHKHTTKADMIATFPEIVEIIQGEPTMHNFFQDTSTPDNMCGIARLLQQQVELLTCVSR